MTATSKNSESARMEIGSVFRDCIPNKDSAIIQLRKHIPQRSVEPICRWAPQIGRARLGGAAAGRISHPGHWHGEMLVGIVPFWYYFGEILQMDWTVTGALGGLAILAGVVGYGSFALIHSDAGPLERDSKPTALIPARDRPPSASATTAVNSQTLLSSPASSMASPHPFVITDESSYAARMPPPVPPQNLTVNPSESDGNIPVYSTASAYAEQQPEPVTGRRYPAGSLPIRPNPYGSGSQVYGSGPQLYDDAPRINRPPANLAARYSPPPGYGDTALRPSANLAARYSPPPGYGETALPRPARMLPASLPLAEENVQWRVVTTAKASYFNLGGHVDKNGVVDSLASQYLRDALKKHQYYAKLPPGIRAYIDAPNIDLTKIAPYRTLLGVDDRKMELEQGVRFIKVASSRGIDLLGPDSAAAGAGVKAAPLDMDSLQTMGFDIDVVAMVAFIP